MTTDEGGGPRESDVADPFEALTDRQLDLEVDRLIDHSNAGIKASDAAKEGVANELFRGAFQNQTRWVLGGEVLRTRVYEAIAAHAGTRLDLDEEGLALYVRIGALNQRLAASRWPDLKWSRKEALVALVAVPDGLATLRKGVTYASRSNVTVKMVEAWVQAALPKEESGSGGRPRGPTFGGFQTYTTRGLEMVARAEQLVEQIRTAPAKKRKKLLSELRTLQDGLGKILAEFDSDD